MKLEDFYRPKLGIKIDKLFGKFTKWKTKDGKNIMVSKLNKRHLQRIVDMFGSTKIRNEYHFIWYKYLKDSDVK